MKLPRWWHRSMLRDDQVEVVSENDFVAIRDAEVALGLRLVPWLNILAARGILKRAALKPGPWQTQDIGFTRSSVEAEARWWQGAGRGERRSRKIKLCLGLGVNSV